MPRKGTARYEIEVRDAKGARLILTTAEWTDTERNVAMRVIFRLVGRPAVFHGLAKPAPKRRNGSRSNEASSPANTSTEATRHPAPGERRASLRVPDLRSHG